MFIVGSPRSGTTYLQNLLASHPSIHTGEETHLFERYIGPSVRAWERHLERGIAGLGLGIGLPCYFDEAEFYSRVKKFALSLLEPMLQDLGEKDIFLEKTPEHLYSIDLIVTLFPKSRFIYILRNGRDVVASLLGLRRSFGRNWAPKKARHAAKSWCKAVEAFAIAKQKLQPWQYRELRFENLVANPVSTIKELSDFLGVRRDTKDIESAVNLQPNGRSQISRDHPFNPAGELGKRVSVVSKEEREKRRVTSSRIELTLWDKFWIWWVARRTLSDLGY